MTSVKTTVPSGGKRRRTVDKTGRRFSVNIKKKALPNPATTSRKLKNMKSIFRVMAFGAFFFIALSTASLWRRRALKRSDSPRNKQSPILFSSFRRFRHHRLTPAAEQTSDEPAKSNQETDVETSSKEHGGNHTKRKQSHEENDDPEAPRSHDFSTEKADGDTHSIEHEASRHVASHHEEPHREGSHQNSHEEEPLSEDLPERIEWYSRDDYKEGTRPMCRISKPYILSNGTILVPDWMEKYGKLLQRCGLGKHGFYSTHSGPDHLERNEGVDADFALTIHPERFQEPTHAASIYLTEHVLKASYLFDVFGGFAQPIDGVKEHHCYTTSEDSKCTIPRPVRSRMKPAIFVPKRIENGPPSAWSRKLIDMFGNAHGHGAGVIHLNASTILIKSHAGKSDELLGTHFRSILTTDGMFRHLPPNSLEHSRLYSAKNGIDKSPKHKSTDSSCSLVAGIAHSSDESKGALAVSALKKKIETVSKFAVPTATVEVRQIEISPTTELEDHIKEIQELDIFVAGSGDDMSSIGYLRTSSLVFELMPFGIKPNTHESLARALGVRFEFVRGKPQNEAFKKCVDNEIFNLRKKGKLKFTEQPEWHDPVLKAWDSAVGEQALSGSSDFDILSAEAPVNNYYSRLCAQKQKIEVGLEETARKIALIAKEICTSKGGE